MRFAAMAAIALTLIIACPIVLGYALASEDVEETHNVETGSIAITDALLNSKSDYFIDYNKTNNNSTMLQRITTQGNTYYTYVSPDFVSVGDKYTSIQAFTTTATDSAIEADPQTQTVTVPSVPNSPGGVVFGYSQMLSDWGNNYTGRALATYGNTYYYHIEKASGSSSVYVFIDGQTDTNYPTQDEANAGGIQSDYLDAVYAGNGEYYFKTSGGTYVGSWAFICIDPSGSFSVTNYAYKTVGSGLTDWHLEMPNRGMVRIPNGSGGYTYFDGIRSISHTSGYVFFDDQEVDNPSSIEISSPSAVLSTYSKTYTQYADPAYGWYNAESSFPIYYNAWYNQYQNSIVTFYVHFTGNGRTEFYEDFTAVSPLLQLNRANDTVTANNENGSVTLGAYAYAQIIFDTNEDTVTVSGLTSWPAMGAAASPLNSITLDYDFDGYIEQLKIVDQYSSIYPIIADNYTTNGNSVSITRTIANPAYTLRVLDSDNNAVTSGWTGTMSADLLTATFTPTSLPTGLYKFVISSPQVGGYSETVYVGSLSPVTTSPIAYRVDSAEVVAGQYPSTVDYTLNLWSLFPDDSIQRVYLNSIGVYGDSLTVGGMTYAVNDGAITVTDLDSQKQVEIRLLHTSISMELVDGQYNVYIGGHRVATVNSAPTVYFGGEWSLTATRSTLTEETVVKTKWVPGEFVLDSDGFVLVMLLAAGGAFVVLGMTGARSGAKIGLLALICGGAVVIGLIII